MFEFGYDSVCIECTFHFFSLVLCFVFVMDDNLYGLLQLEISYK